MPAITTAYVKNIIRRGFSELVDPSPDPAAQLSVWDHFGDSCAYCGKAVRRGAKEGHLDHLVSASKGGANAIGNRVLSCAPCNESEKLDRPWDDFLRSKATNEADYEARRQRILDWQQRNAMAARSELLAFARAHADEVVAAFDRAVEQVRQESMRGR